MMMKAMFAMLALVLGLTFGATTFVQADEKKAAPAAEKKEEKKAAPAAEKKAAPAAEKKAEKK